MTTTVDVVDLFTGGAGGWHHGLQRPSLGIDLDRWAVATRHAAGHTVQQADVTLLDPADYPCRILAASPTCRPYTLGGKQEGIHDRAVVAEAIDDLAAGRDTRTQHRARCTNTDSLLAAEPMRWIHALRPRSVLMEQVPAVMPLWKLYAAHLTGWGYSVWTGVLDAADYGTPQNRRRALLAASLDNEVAAPEPTHRRPRSMADALDIDPATVLITRRDSAARIERYGARRNRTAAEPAPSITGECWRWKWQHPDGREEPLTPAQAAVLQGLPAEHPWQGPKTRIALQIGNAIPRQLAAAAYRASLGAGAQQLSLAAA
ncbi:DNA cytosine methyltransferase [Streptomyces sp. MN6]